MTAEDWSRWYTRSHAATPERCFVELKPSLPPSVDSVIDFGCAAGRNLAAFAGTHRLYGVDLVPRDKLELQVDGLTYFQSRLQDFRIDEPLDRFVCIAHGTLMYLDGGEQRRFLAYLRERGCQNFILQEYDAETLVREGYFEPTLYNRLRRRRRGFAFTNPFGFGKRWFRPEIPAWIALAPGGSNEAG